MTSFHCDPMLSMRRFPGAVLFLASDDSSYIRVPLSRCEDAKVGRLINAVELVVDGGATGALPSGLPFFAADRTELRPGVNE